MYRTRSKVLAIAFLLYAAGVATVAHAGAARASDDGSRLAHAYHQMLAAEMALRAHPEAASTFGPMLREARERLEAGIAAATATGVAGDLPAHAIDTANPASSNPSDLRPACADCSAQHSTSEPKASSNDGPALRPHLRVPRLIWA